MRALHLTPDVALTLAGLAVFVGVVVYFATRPTEVVAIEGRELFVRYCASCHGVSGRGDGPAAAALQPRLRTSRVFVSDTGSNTPCGASARPSTAAARSECAVTLPSPKACSHV
jgi:mono/diheme cytochrome c family protein